MAFKPWTKSHNNDDTLLLLLLQRALGDIDGKLCAVHPLLEFISSNVKDDIGLAGVTKTNPSNKKTAEEIVEEDRERMANTAHRVR